MKKLWYAVMKNCDDNDWGYGSYDLDQAKEMVKPFVNDGGYIAIINEENDPVCIDEIKEV